LCSIAERDFALAACSDFRAVPRSFLILNMMETAIPMVLKMGNHVYDQLLYYF
jgi:hypothetical protein